MEENENPSKNMKCKFQVSKLNKSYHHKLLIMKKYVLGLQICGSIIVSLVYVNMGALMGFPTKALPQLRNETDVNVNLDDYQGSMFASVSFITGIKTL